jgi:hypothetical protein
MSRHDDDYPQRGPRSHEERRDPYESRRQVRTFGDDREWPAEHPWRAAHPQQAHDRGGTRAPRWSEQPARYGGDYRDDELWSGQRDDARYGLDTDNERAYAQRGNRPRQAYGQWQPQRDYARNRSAYGQDNSGYGAERSYGQGNDQDDARSDYAHASWTQEHDYQGPRYGASHRDTTGSQYAHTDTYGGAGFRQQGKRYWFDEGDQRGAFRGTRPRGYERSDERVRELACERLTEADLDASDIEVKVSQGTVTLEGSVPARWMKHQAEDIIDDLGNVKDIQNHLRVSPREGAPGAAGSPATGSTSAASGGPMQGSDIGGRSRH